MLFPFPDDKIFLALFEKNSILNNLPNFNFEGIAYYVEPGDPIPLIETPDEPLLTTIGRVPTIQEEVELGAL